MDEDFQRGSSPPLKKIIILDTFVALSSAKWHQGQVHECIVWYT